MSKLNLQLPEYATWYIHGSQDQILRQQAATLTFPLSSEDLDDVKLLEHKFDQEAGAAGLAAPQIGITKRVIIFQAPDDAELKQRRSDLVQTMPKTIWLNPSFTPQSEEMREDFEGCFSLPNVFGKVPRYIKIRYDAYDIEGNHLSGEATGFLARVIQHEIDHLNGKLLIDHVPLESLIDKAEYVELLALQIDPGT